MQATGTDTGGMLGHAPTGRRFAITVIDVARYDGDLMVEHWGVPDRFGLLEQLGHCCRLAPSPALTAVTRAPPLHGTVARPTQFSRRRRSKAPGRRRGPASRIPVCSAIARRNSGSLIGWSPRPSR